MAKKKEPITQGNTNIYPGYMAADKKSVVVNEMTLVAPNRNRKDVGTLKSGIERAESVYTPNRTQLYDLYHDVKSIDGHLSGIIKKRVDAITNKYIKFTRNKQKVDEMDTLIESSKFIRIIELIMESLEWGTSGIEFVIGKELDFVEIPRKHIRPEKGIITKSQYDYNGTDIDKVPFAWVVGQPKNLGYLLQCAMYALYKRSGFGDFAQFVEIFGQPVRIIYYDAYDTKTKQELQKILTESGGSLSMMIPQQAKFEMVDGKTSNATGQLQKTLIDACNSEMDVCVLGNTETTTSSKSSGYAQSQTHADQQLEITKSDMKYVLGWLNDPHFLWILKSYGYPVDGGRFEFEIELDLANLKERLDIDERVSAFVPISDDYWYETYGVPKPDNYQELKDQRTKDNVSSSDKRSSNTTDNASSSDKRSSKSNTKNLSANLNTLLSFFGLAPKDHGAHLDY